MIHALLTSKFEFFESNLLFTNGKEQASRSIHECWPAFPIRRRFTDSKRCTSGRRSCCFELKPDCSLHLWFAFLYLYKMSLQVLPDGKFAQWLLKIVRNATLRPARIAVPSCSALSANLAFVMTVKSYPNLAGCQALRHV